MQPTQIKWGPDQMAQLPRNQIFQNAPGKDSYLEGHFQFLFLDG